MDYTINIHIPTKSDLERLWYKTVSLLERKLFKLDNYLLNRFDQRYWKLLYKLTGRCGSIQVGHSPILGNRKSWLWNSTYYRDKHIKTCVICSEKKELSNKLYSSYTNYNKLGRQADMEELVKQRKSAVNYKDKVSIDKAMYMIDHEENHTKAMRQDLIKATRNHDHDKIKETHDYVATHGKYTNDGK